VETFAQLEAWQAGHGRRTVGEAFAELRAPAAAERYALRVPKRKDRPNTFTGVLE
jgi:hypothetical protein